MENNQGNRRFCPVFTEDKENMSGTCDATKKCNLFYKQVSKCFLAGMSIVENNLINYRFRLVAEEPNHA